MNVDECFLLFIFYQIVYILFMLTQYNLHSTVHIGYSDNAEGVDFWAKLSLYPINYVWVPWRRGFIPRDDNITIRVDHGSLFVTHDPSDPSYT